jgi:hypothetical protein
MAVSKQFGPTKDFPKQSPSSGKDILQFTPELDARFIDLLDTFANYTGRGGKFLMVKETEDGITVAEIDSEQILAIADKNYIHTQVAPATIWTVNHNFGKYPSVRIKDETGHPIMGDIVDVNVNQLTIEFSNAKSGVAIIN